MKAKLLISRGRLWHENVLIGEFGALTEDFRVSDVPVLAVSGSMVKTGMASEFQTASDVTKLRILSGLFFSKQPEATASMTAMLPAIR